MELNHGAHLTYCTNVHHGQNWPETFDSLKQFTLAVRRQVCPNRRFAIGLRLGSRAASELAATHAFQEFQRWLDITNCYIFTINGFPYGTFHGAPVKEQVYLPDWTSSDRLNYTNLLFDLLARLVPDGVAGSVSTLPGGFKQFIGTEAQKEAIRQNLWRCIEHISGVSERTGKKLHLGLEPEPLCLLENSAETISFFAQLRDEHPNDPRLEEFLGVNYDCCHFAVEFEQPETALAAFKNAGIRISKIHLSSALKTFATPESLKALNRFSDEVYLHQVISRDSNGKLQFFRDLPDALASNPPGKTRQTPESSEWRIHYHVPLHASAIPPFQNTTDHLFGVLDWVKENPKACSHFEMETYTWDVLPPELKSRTVVEQLAAEYDWTLAQLAARGMA
ncbi:MAG TPA: metabolite traffic protein EboE [Candidatus Sulfotelmatobacter sp.]|nr:metabolite traffic protein EboE [Candidatus Sulfotelmatobacter sp.]